MTTLDDIMEGRGGTRGLNVCHRCGKTGPPVAIAGVMIRKFKVIEGRKQLAGKARTMQKSVCEECAINAWELMTAYLENRPVLARPS